VNDAVRVSTDGLLTTAELAVRPDFTLGLAAVSPSSRTIAGPGGTADVEPRVMQVLVVLADAAGQVVTRGTLFDRCWGGVFVGDDSLNRAVGAIRKLAAEVAEGSFEIETIPRTGYRLTGEVVKVPAEPSSGAAQPRFSRRIMLGTGAAAAAVAGAAGLWTVTRTRSNPRFDALMAHGEEAFRNGSAFEIGGAGVNSSPVMTDLYRQAVRLQPDSARAWGLLAYFLSASADQASGRDSPKVVAEAQGAIRRALAIDPEEPNARVAMFLLQGPMFDWATRDRQLRAILSTDPANLPAMMELMPLLQAAGLTRESWTWNERILKESPFMRASLVVRALKLWIMGRVRESDDVINRVLGLWPDYWFANYARFNILALTGRPRAARAIIDGAHDLPAGKTRALLLNALETRTPSAIAAARAACVQLAQDSPQLANDVVMYLCALGLPDTAFELTEGFLLWRGKMISMDRGNAKTVDEYNRRMTQWLFTPPVAIMRANPRFQKLCDEFGLTAYWRARGVKPDYQVYG
jgi:DNA-binding winged helix-turn-helix (wHTH) protein/tetratricopeptide (TPR) repeat protein